MSSIQELRREAYQVRNETQEGDNTALRIGTLYLHIIDFVAVLDDRTLHPYDDTFLREEIDKINEAIAELDGTLASTVDLVNEEKIRLDELVNSIDDKISDKVSDLLNDADWLEDHAEGIQEMVNEGEIYWKSGWNQDIEAYLQEVGVWARNGDVTKTQWTTIVQSVDEISTTVAEVQEDLAGIPTSLQWSQTTQKVNNIEASVNALLNDGQISEALQSSINLSIDGKISSLNLETTYAKIDTESAKDVLEWIYSALRNETTSEKTYSEIVSAGKSGLLSGISNIHTYVEVVRNGEVLDYVAGATLEAKVNDAITGLYSKASSGDAQTTIFSQVKKDTEDIATIVTHATGDYSSASIATKFDTWKAGLALKTDIDSASVSLLAAMDEKDNASALILEQKIDESSASLLAIMNSKVAGLVTKTDFNSAMAQVVAKDDYNAASIVAMVNNASSSVKINADNINFEFSNSWSVNAKNHGTVMSLSTNGDLTLTGALKNCNVDGTLTVGSGNTKLIISSSGNYGYITGKNGNETYLDITYSGGGHIQLFDGTNSAVIDTYTIRTWNANNHAAFLSCTGGSPGLSCTNGNQSCYFELDANDGTINIKGNFPTTSSSGRVYKDSNGFLKVG